ncbi:hypothetical protein ACH5RR_005088 [Cinchona calisaya]|uniref:Replication factor A C-terminal domain-containing protein n=1 Tax=Cinchona calisaya TaxID=153742 RepID=A0ABD3AZE0_9GENT
MKAFIDSDILLPPPAGDDIITTEKALVIFEKESAVWVGAKTSFIPGNQRLWYTACNNCHKSVNADIDWEITCPSCKDITKVEVRCCMPVLLKDGIASLNTIILAAEKIIPFSVLQLKEANESETPIDAELASSIEKHTIVCFVHHYAKDIQGQLNKRRNVVKAYTNDEMFNFFFKVVDEDMTSMQTNLELQMFTPTTKNMLEEIVGSSNDPN